VQANEPAGGRSTSYRLDNGNSALEVKDIVELTKREK